MLRLLKRNLVKRFCSLKTAVLFLVGVGVMFTQYQHITGEMGIQMVYIILEGPLDVFIQLVSKNNSSLIVTMVLAIMVLVFVESPVVNQDDRFFIMRVGKKKWIVAEVLGILCTSMIWIFFITLMGCISNFNHMDWTDWRIYHNNLYCVIVYFLAFSCIGLLILLFHLWNIKALGTAVMVTLFLLEYFILDVLPNNIAAFDKDANTQSILSGIKKYTFMNRMETGSQSGEFVFSVIYFSMILILLAGVNIRYARRHEIG